MDEKYQNTSCAFYGMKYCSLLNMESCEKCSVKHLGSEGVSQMQSDLDALISLIPEADTSALFLRDDCALCKGESRRRKKCYALTTLGNLEPAERKLPLFGTKLRSGSLLRLQIASCKRCRRNYHLVEYVPVTIAIVIAVLGLILFGYRPFREAVADVASWLPIVLFIAIIGVGFSFAYIIRRLFIEQLGMQTEFNIMKLPLLKGFASRGWFEIEQGRDVSHLVFMKKNA